MDRLRYGHFILNLDIKFLYATRTTYHPPINTRPNIQHGTGRMFYGRFVCHKLVRFLYSPVRPHVSTRQQSTKV